MRVATWRGGSEFTIDEAPEPSPGPGEILVSVHTSGVCGSDVHATKGLFPFAPPRVLAAHAKIGLCNGFSFGQSGMDYVGARPSSMGPPPEGGT